ncbi:MAG: RNA polymerase sigma factor [Planctomycetaceae bacterium]
MTALPEDFNRRLRTGDGEVANWIFERFARRLAGLASANIGSKLRQRIDPEDVLQSAFRTFFRRAERGDFQIDQSGSLWSLLAQIVVLKSRFHARTHQAQIRDLEAEEPGDPQAFLEQVAQREPSVEDAISVSDLIECVLTGAPEEWGEIVALTLEGRTLREVAEKMGLSHQTIKRVLDRVRVKLEQEL